MSSFNQSKSFFCALCLVKKVFEIHVCQNWTYSVSYWLHWWLQEKGEVELEDSELKGRHSNRSGPL